MLANEHAAGRSAVGRQVDRAARPDPQLPSSPGGFGNRPRIESAHLPVDHGGRLAPVPQPDDGVTYAAKIAKQEAVIDWTRRAVEIDRQVRAFNPWPVAETTWGGRQLRIWSGRPVDVPTAGAAPGGVIDRDRDRLVVATGVGAYEITRVQLAGRNALPATEFLRAHDLAGECLGR